MILCWLARWVAKPIAMQIPEMVQCPLLHVCTICGEGLPSSRAVFDGHHWAFPWGVEGELIPGKTRGPLEVGVPPLCLAPHTPASHPPCALQGCVCHGSSISTLLCVWRPFCPHFFHICRQCVFNAGLAFFPCVGHRAGNVPVLMLHASSSTSTPSALSYVALCLCAQVKNPGSAFPNFRGDLIVAGSQVII